MKRMKSILLAVTLAMAFGTEAAQKIGVFKWARNGEKAEKLLADLKAIGEDAEITTGYDFSSYDVTFIPDAWETPLELRDAIPTALKHGSSLILDGWAEKTIIGDREAREWSGPMPSTTHCLVDINVPMRGLRNQKGASVTLRNGENLSVKFPDVKAEGVTNVSGKIMTKCQWRLDWALGRGKMEYRDCMEATPLEIIDGSGKVIGQHTVMVKHFCSFFPGSVVLCADFQRDPALKLLYGPQGKEYLKFLLETVRTELPDEPSTAYVQNLIKFKKKITELKLLYNEVAYQMRDVQFLIENAKEQGTAVVENPSNLDEFKKLEQSAFELFSNFTKFRFNQFPFAVKRKEKLINETDGLILKFKDFSRNLKILADTLSSERKFTMPEKGEIDVKLSFADYDPCSWGGSPGYLEYENGRLINSLGIVGNCYYSYCGGRHGYKLITPEHIDYMENYTNVFEKYCKETGYTKCTSHELSTNMIPLELWKKYNKHDYIYDLEKETVRPATDRDFSQFYGGNGIISEAIESKEFKEMIEYLAKYAADMPGVHTRSISLEGMQIGGYSEYGFAKFREFLKKRHGSIEGLNKTWGSSYNSFDEIKPLAKYQETREEYCNHFDWVEFRSSEFLKFYKFIHDTYKKYDKIHPLTACINQYSPLAAVEFYEFNRYTDFAGSHNTPTFAAWYQIGLARRGQLADNNEPKWINFDAPWNNSSAEDELQKCQRWNMIYYSMQGMSQFAPYEWREGTVARFGEYDGYLNLSGVEFKEFTKWLKKWQGLMGAVPPKDCAKTALYWSFVTKAQSKTGFQGDKSGQSLFRSYFKLLDNWNRTMNALQIPFGMVTRGKIRENDLGNIKCIIVPQAAYLEPDIMDALLKFAREGGELVLEGSVGKFDQYRREDERIFDAIGIVQLPAKGGKLDDGTAVQSLMTQEDVGPEYMSFDMIAHEKVKVLAKYKDGRPAAVRTAYGKGQVTCLGFSLSGNTKAAVAKRYLGASLAMREFTSSMPDVRIFPWQGHDGFRYVAVLNYSGDWRTIPVECVGKVAEAYDVETGCAMNVKDGHRISVSLFPAGGRVIAVKFEDAKEGVR